MKERWQNPLFRERMLQTNNHPDHMKRMTQRLLEKQQDPEFKRELRQHQRAGRATKTEGPSLF